MSPSAAVYFTDVFLIIFRQQYRSMAKEWDEHHDFSMSFLLWCFPGPKKKTPKKTPAIVCDLTIFVTLYYLSSSTLGFLALQKKHWMLTAKGARVGRDGCVRENERQPDRNFFLFKWLIISARQSCQNRTQKYVEIMQMPAEMYKSTSYA